MDISKQVAEYFWWHSIDLGNGIITKGAKTPEAMRVEAEMLFGPVNVVGKSVLDIGTWNGGFLVEALRRGAARLAGLDHVTWRLPELRGRETFDLVSKSFGDKFEAYDIDLDAPRLNLDPVGQFDIVLYSGVFYHLFDPIAATREVAALAKEVLVIETYVEITDDKRPLMVFFPGAELNSDPTNWWGPNTQLMIELIGKCGFGRIDVTDGVNPNRKVLHAYR